MATGKIKTLFSDKEKTEALFPRTKTSAISDDNGIGLDAILDNMVHSSELIEDVGSIPINADTLGGRAANEYATALYVNNIVNNSVEVYSGTSAPSIEFDYKIWLKPEGNSTTIFIKNSSGGWEEMDTVSGVYVNSGTMPDGYNIQIDPTGEPIDNFFAPAGYGLGTLNGKVTTDCNTATANGFYTLSGDNLTNPPPGDLRYGTMLVLNRYSNNNITQIAYCKNNMAIRYYYNSAWSAWEGFGVRIKKLWENATPTATFAAQTLALDLSGYDSILCVGKVSTSTLRDVPLVMAKVGGGDAMITAPISGKNCRRVLTATTTGVTFNAAESFSSYASATLATDNTYLVPNRIYGIKGVS